MLTGLFTVWWVSIVAQASTDQCPRLAGRFFCEAVEGSHADMIMTIGEERCADTMKYRYSYEFIETPEEPLELEFLASDEGTPNPQHGGMIGRCVDGRYFNSDDGEVGEHTLFNLLDDRGHYLVIRAKDGSTFLDCEPRPETKPATRASFRCE